MNTNFYNSSIPTRFEFVKGMGKIFNIFLYYII